LERIALLVRCARDIGSLTAAAAALKALEELGPADRERFDATAMLSRIHHSLSELATPLPPPATAEPVPEAPPSSWSEWINRLSAHSRWRAAVHVAEIGAREWSFEAFAADPSSVAEFADLLLIDRPEWGQAALRDALPYLVEFLLVHGSDPRIKTVLDSLFLAIAMDEQMSLSQFATLTRVVEARLEFGISAEAYTEAITQLNHAIELVASPAAASAGLDALDMLIASPCPQPSARESFVAQVSGFFARWYRRIDASQWALLGQLGSEVGVPIVAPPAVEGEAEAGRASIWSRLDGKRVALYSLRESALRRVETVLRELCPGAHVQTFMDHVGGSPSLRTAAGTADVFVVATAAAKHAATIFIDANRPKSRTTLFARGQGSASLLDALRGHLE
jgi:hypothetical protein